MLAKRSRPVAAIVAAEESAGRGGLSGALKSLHAKVIKWAMVQDILNTPWHNPVCRNVIHEITCHSPGGYEVIGITSAIEHCAASGIIPKWIEYVLLENP
jgi:hypothetical protein